jgi:hypothetical protein
MTREGIFMGEQQLDNDSCPDCQGEGYTPAECKLKGRWTQDSDWYGTIERAVCSLCGTRFVRYGRFKEWSAAI